MQHLTCHRSSNPQVQKVYAKILPKMQPLTRYLSSNPQMLHKMQDKSSLEPVGGGIVAIYAGIPANVQLWAGQVAIVATFRPGQD
ncbi:hypothetical protein MKY96_17485 [Paenibacillus sp. FSL R7-0302]|uniref:hypothetical protein n=1 Tax=Paenibacillus sp. FSL R7-0302 TaxID=2921681 RepID=UPI0030F74552